MTLTADLSRRDYHGAMERTPVVYILASGRNGTLYVGVTANLVRRVWEHKTRQAKGFSSRYDVHLLVWFEVHATMASAIEREKRIKKWRREWKLGLIERSNTEWNDLYPKII